MYYMLCAPFVPGSFSILVQGYFAVLCFEAHAEKNDGREWRVANRKTKMYRRTLTRNGKKFISRNSCATRICYDVGETFMAIPEIVVTCI